EISSAALAMAIQAQIGIVNELPNNGIRSDKTIYGTGFAVLRASSMPAVLVEVGYINNDNDREYLLNEEWQGKMAEAIAFGIRSYLGDGDNIALQRPDPVDQDRK
ncbi:MAG: N-acetylmuramoyl-L-alanine amidase, partial [bacterium]